MDYSDLTLYLRYGDKGSGKSLLGAVTQKRFLEEYDETKTRYPELPVRVLFTSEKLSEEIEKKYLGRTLFYWSDPKQLKYCPRPNCWKTKEGVKHYGLDYEHQNNPEGKHPPHDCDIYWSEIGRHLGADRSKDTPYWLKDLFAFCRKDGNRILMDTQVYEDISIAVRRQLGHASFCVKDFGSRDISATEPPPVPWTFKNLLNFKKRVIWGQISEYEFDPKLLEWERDPEARMRIQEENQKVDKIFIRKKYIDIYDTKHRIPPYKAGLQHVETWCENDNCPLHGKKSLTSKPKIEHYKI